MINLSDFYSAGYQLIKPIPRDRSHDVLPPFILSGSEDICDKFPNFWCWEDGSATVNDTVEKARILGVKENEIQNIYLWVNALYDERRIEWPGLFMSLETAIATRMQFFEKDNDICAIGFGLNRELLDTFLSENISESSVHRAAIERKEYLSNKGKILGFELLGLEGSYSFSHSWLCHGIEKELFKLCGKYPNEHGMVSEYKVALEISNQINSGKIGAEPALWLPWLMVSYN